MVSVLAALLVTGLTVLHWPGPQHWPSPQQPPRSVPAAALVGSLMSGRGVDETGVLVQGDLDLRPLGTVRHPFRCRDCTFSGTINATDVVFDRIVDLSGSTVRGALRLTGAQCHSPFLLDAPPGHHSEIQGPVDVRLATFSETTSMDGAIIRGVADFTTTQFLSGVSFAGTAFRSATRFDRARFGAATSFADGSSRGLSMQRATFAGSAAFRKHHFHADADFTGAAFQGPANFTLAEYDRTARYDSASFDSGATFRLVSATSSASFRSAQAHGPLIFDGAVFARGISLADLAVDDLLSLRSIRVVTGDGLELDQLSATRLLLDVPTVDQIRGVAVQQEVLGLLEKSAEQNGNLPLANDARYQRLTVQAARSGPVYRVFDWVVSREVAGYLVRPLAPLRAMLFVFLVAIVVRTVPAWWRSRSAGGRGSTTRLMARSAWLSGRQLAAKRPQAEWQSEDVPSWRTVAVWAEYLTHKILIVVFLLCLGNSNPTVRQIIDAIVRG